MSRHGVYVYDTIYEIYLTVRVAALWAVNTHLQQCEQFIVCHKH